MITPKSFIAKWQTIQGASLLPEDFDLVTADADCLAGLAMPQAAKDFLIRAGLPRSAAPGLDFEDVESLPRLWSVYGLKKNTLKQYCIIGYDGAGNPLCIDEENAGRVVLLDHEDNFRTVQFVNSSVIQLAETLILANSPSPSQQLLLQIEKIDTPAAQEGCFWWHEAQGGQDED